MKKNLSYIVLCLTLLFASCAKEKHVCEVVIHQSELTLSVGENFTLTSEVTVMGKISDVGVSWSTSDATVATIASSGEVTALSEGLAVITASSNADPSKKAVCFINVY